MAKKPELQESKEFQLKVIWPTQTGTPGVTDKEIFDLVTKTIASCVLNLAGKGKSEMVFNNNQWQREGIRFDTAGKELKKHDLTLAIEATDQRTKLKSKQHNFVSELLFDKPKKSVCYPDINASGEYKKHDTKLKREQDLHFSNLKYCASGSLFLKGRHTTVKNLAFFADYFPGLSKLLPAKTALQEISHWDEFVFDDMRTAWDDTVFDSWMLVNRWQHKDKQLLESELSFKVEKSMADDWDYTQLAQASALYLELQKSGVFQPVPPIFFFNDPVSSHPVKLVKE